MGGWWQALGDCPYVRDTSDDMEHAMWVVKGDRPTGRLPMGSILEPTLMGETGWAGPIDETLRAFHAAHPNRRRMQVVWRPDRPVPPSPYREQVWVPVESLVRLGAGAAIDVREAGPWDENVIEVVAVESSLRDPDAEVRVVGYGGDGVVVPVRFARGEFSEEGFSLPRVLVAGGRHPTAPAPAPAPDIRAPVADAGGGCSGCVLPVAVAVVGAALAWSFIFSPHSGPTSPPGHYGIDDQAGALSGNDTESNRRAVVGELDKMYARTKVGVWLVFVPHSSGGDACRAMSSQSLGSRDLLVLFDMGASQWQSCNGSAVPLTGAAVSQALQQAWGIDFTDKVIRFVEILDGDLPAS